MSDKKKKTPEEQYAEAMDDAYKHCVEVRKKIANQIMRSALRALFRTTNKNREK